MAVAAAQDLYLDRIDKFLAGRARSDPAWLTTIRRTAVDRFGTVGFPGPRDEEWQFFNVSPIVETPFREAPAEPAPVTKAWQIAPFLIKQLACSVLVFVNGRFERRLSALGPLPRGSHVMNLAQALQSDPGLVDPYITRVCASYDRHAFTALNTAFADDGAFVYLPAGALATELYILYFSTADAPIVTYPRTIVVAGDHSQAKIIECYAGGAGQFYFTNAVTEIVQGENAVVDYSKLHGESEKSFHIATLQVHRWRKRRNCWRSRAS